MAALFLNCARGGSSSEGGFCPRANIGKEIVRSSAMNHPHRKRARWGSGLEVYLSSGKSSAMAMSLRPISFHCFSRAADGLASSFGDAAFFAESWAYAGSTKAPATKKNKASRENFFIGVSLH